MRRIVFGLSLFSCTTTTVAEPADATAPGSQARAVEDPPAPAAATVKGPVATPSAAADRPTQAYNCQAPLLVIEEVTRLLTAVGTHATRSAACVDGPGQRVTLDEILVCPLAPDGTRRPFGVTYRATTWTEGGRRVCPGTCPPIEAEHTFHRIDVAFRPEAGKYVIEVPKAVPGLPLDATPATADHDGNCYGPSPAFVPQALALR